MNTGISFSIFGKKTSSMGGCAVRPEERHFAQCREFGIDAVELLVLKDYLDPGDWHKADEVRKWADRYGVRINSIHGPGGWPNNGHWIADPDEEIRRRSVEERILTIETAQRLGAGYCVVEFEAYTRWPHKQNPTTAFPSAQEYWRHSLDELLKTAERTGVKLALENIEALATDQLAKIIAGLDPKLAGICFDTSHASFNGRLREELDLLAPYIIGTHLSDNDALTGAEYVDRHWIPFTGAVDWKYVMEKITQYGRCECAILEVLDRNDPRITEALAGACRKLKEISST